LKARAVEDEVKRMPRTVGKNIEKARSAVEKRPYTLQEAVPLLQKIKFAKFDETIDLTMRLGVDREDPEGELD
jgi:large subunit ribosomal protein L1